VDRARRRARPGRLLAIALLCFVSGAPFCLPANGAAAAGKQGTSAANIPAPPEVMRNKPPIPDQLLKDKREGDYFTGLPLIGVTPESGIVYGATIQWYDNGPKNSPFFSYAPYRKKVNAIVDFGTKGRQEYILEYDQPYRRSP
jgi:hypothetical protein